jgi:hypothetical protein
MTALPLGEPSQSVQLDLARGLGLAVADVLAEVFVVVEHRDSFRKVRRDAARSDRDADGWNGQPVS